MTTASTHRPHFGLLKFSANAGYIYCVTILTAWALIAGFLPPPPEYWGKAEVYAFFTENSTRIRIGMALTLFVTPLYYIWATGVSRVMEQIEGPRGILAPIQLMGAFATVVVTLASVTAWLSAAFQPEIKGPEAVKAISDYAWMWFNPTAAVTMTQYAAFGVSCLLDARKEPLMPRGLGWFSFAMLGTLAVAELTPFFYTGIFAWHGLFTYWVGLGGFFIWILVATYFVRRAVSRLEMEEMI